MSNGHPQTWFVKASFGVEWGPLSDDTLLQMADNSSFASEDLARCGTDENWRPILEVLDELRSRTSSSTRNSERVIAREELSASGTEATATVDHNEVSSPPARRRTGVLPGWANYWSPNSDGAKSPQLTLRLLAADTGQHDQAATNDTLPGDSPSGRGATTDPAMALSPSRMLNEPFAELDNWKRERQEQLSRLMKIAADREKAEAESLELAHTSPVATETAEEPATIAENATVTLTSTPDLAISSVRPRFSTSAENWLQTIDRWRRSLPDLRIAVALLLVMVAGWWYWPESIGNAGEKLQTMYHKLRELRELENDHTGMAEFVAHSQAQLDWMIPALKKRATPTKPESQWLLWMAQDCMRPMLKNPRQRDTKPEITFQKLLAEWRRRHDPNFEEDGDSPPLIKENEKSPAKPSVPKKDDPE